MSTSKADAWFKASPIEQQATLRSLRRLIMSLTTGVTEEFKWSRPCYSTSRGLFCYLHSTKGYATLGFQRGVDLNDPTGLLEGTGKGMRHVKITRDCPPSEKALLALLKQAVDA
jgi:hypothetical protein